MNTLTSSVVDRRRPPALVDASASAAHLTSAVGSRARSVPLSTAKSPVAMANLATTDSLETSRGSGVIGDAYTPVSDVMYDSPGPEAVGGAGRYAEGAWPTSLGSTYDTIGGELPFNGTLGRFNMPVHPRAGAELTPEHALTLYGARLDVDRTQLRPVNRFDPNVIDVRVFP